MPAISTPTAEAPQYQAPTGDRGLRVAVWGGTGATGGELIRQCLAEPRIAGVIAFTRRPIAIDDPRVTQVHVEDFLDMAPHRHAFEGVDVGYWCLGVSQLAEPRANGYRRVTRDYTVAGAQALMAENPDASFHFVSGMGTARTGLSPVMWGRIKGEAEKALAELGLRRLLSWRPTFIHAAAGRERPNGTDRFAEMLGLRAIPLLTNSTMNIAHAMLHATFDTHEDGPRDKIYWPWSIDQLGRRYRHEREQGK